MNANALAAPYRDGDGGKAIRLLTPCADQSCNWVDMQIMTTRRWYPTLGEWYQSDPWPAL